MGVAGGVSVPHFTSPIAGLVVVFDWQYSTKRPGNDSNTTFASSYSTFDLGTRYTSVAPSNITGTNLGNMVAHIGAPRTVAASMSIDF